MATLSGAEGRGGARSPTIARRLAGLTHACFTPTRSRSLASDRQHRTLVSLLRTLTSGCALPYFGRTPPACSSPALQPKLLQSPSLPPPLARNSSCSSAQCLRLLPPPSSPPRSSSLRGPRPSRVLRRRSSRSGTRSLDQRSVVSRLRGSPFCLSSAGSRTPSMPAARCLNGRARLTTKSAWLLTRLNALLSTHPPRRLALPCSLRSSAGRIRAQRRPPGDLVQLRADRLRRFSHGSRPVRLSTLWLSS